MAEQNKEDRFKGPEPAPRLPKPDRADDQFNKPSDIDPAADAKSPLDPDANWEDQSQGPSRPLDDSGRKRP
jgi:hypothetical protein